MNRSPALATPSPRLVPVFRTDARDDATEERLRKLHAEHPRGSAEMARRAQEEQERRDIRAKDRAAQEQAALKLMKELLPAKFIADRTKLPLKAVKALAKQHGVKLPSQQSWL